MQVFPWGFGRTHTVITEHNVYVVLPHSHQKLSVTRNVQGMDWLRHVVIPDGVPERRGRVYVKMSSGHFEASCTGIFPENC